MHLYGVYCVFISAMMQPMRLEKANSVIQAEADAQNELMSTGEAARLLNSSRQHVVDLCDRGDLPFVTVGKHRRVKRTDVESVRDRTQRLTRDQRRSLWLAFAVAGQIVANPSAAHTLAKQNLVKMNKNARGQATAWLDEWDKLLNGQVGDMLTALTSRSPRGRDLRQNSPFAGILSEDERMQVLSSWKKQELKKRNK